MGGVRTSNGVAMHTSRRVIKLKDYIIGPKALRGVGVGEQESEFDGGDKQTSHDKN